MTQSIATRLIKSARWIAGMFFLFLGVLGVILPVMPGLVFFVPAMLLLGRRDPALRRTHLLGRQVLRMLRRARTPLIRQLGLRLSAEYVRVRRVFIAALTSAERRLSTRAG